MSKFHEFFCIANGWIYFKPAKGERTTKEHMDQFGRQLGALPFEMVQREIEVNGNKKEEVFVVFFDVRGGSAEAFLVLGPKDLLDIEAMLWKKRDCQLYYYAIPLELMDKGLKKGQYLVRLTKGRSHLSKRE